MHLPACPSLILVHSQKQQKLSLQGVFTLAGFVRFMNRLWWDFVKQSDQNRPTNRFTVSDPERSTDLWLSDRTDRCHQSTLSRTSLSLWLRPRLVHSDLSFPVRIWQNHQTFWNFSSSQSCQQNNTGILKNYQILKVDVFLKKGRNTHSLLLFFFFFCHCFNLKSD